MMRLISNKQSFVLEPGKKIDYINGEILSIKLSQWGITGKIDVNSGIYNYKLKDPDMIRNISVGLDLAIYNGFCFKNKKGEIIITDGKFGSTNILVQLSRFFSLTDKQKTRVTCIIKSINNTSGNVILEVELLFPNEKHLQIIIPDHEIDSWTNIIEKKENLIENIVTLDIIYKNKQYFLDALKILPENHFLYKFVKMKGGISETIPCFTLIISNQIRLIENYYEILKDMFLGTGKDISKNSLLELRELLYSKVLDGNLKFPYNILIQKEDIEKYLDSLIAFFKNLITSETNYIKPEDFLIILRFYFPSFSILKYEFR